MSRLTELIRQARRADEQLGKDLGAEIAGLMKRRTFGLVFEQHRPEAVELPERCIRRGDKVRVLPPRGDAMPGEQRLWRVTQIKRADGHRVANLVELDAEDPETRVVVTDDLIVVAEFRDRIYPGLVETGRVERGGDKPFHTVINAENYHALEMLTYTHRHSIDAIYIDPPYNTGAKDWKYNNNYVESDDDYRHSKWLAFMERRLKVARELLKPEDSVLIVTIDEKEYLRLGLLLEQTFPEARIQMVSSVINPAGSSRRGMFSRTDEYIFFLLFGEAMVVPGTSDMLNPTLNTTAVRWDSLQRRGEGGRREGHPELFYAIYFEKGGRLSHCSEPIPYGTNEPEEQLGFEALVPVKPDGTAMRWGISGPELMRRLALGAVRYYKGRDGKWVIRFLQQGTIAQIIDGSVVRDGEDELGFPKWIHALDRRRIPMTTWKTASHSASDYATPMLSAMLGRRHFPFPKSLYAVEDTLRFFIKDKPNAVVLDFFSGSGTTAHSVMRLNKQDGGRRQCISVTNNEVSAGEQKRLRKDSVRTGDPEWEAQGICDYITKPRITAAITGSTPGGDPIKGDYKFTDEFPMSEGLEENAAFFTLIYETQLSVKHNRAFERIAPMLWLRAGAQGPIIKDLRKDGWDVADTYGVLENLDHAGDFLACVTEEKAVGMAFIVTDDDSAFQMICRDLPSHALPVRLYESYLQNFQINTGRAR